MGLRSPRKIDRYLETWAKHLGQLGDPYGAGVPIKQVQASGKLSPALVAVSLFLFPQMFLPARL